MKPIIIFISEEKDGKIIITKDELQRIVDEAYQQGKAENNNHYYYTNPPTWNYGTTAPPTWDYTKVTC